MDQAVTQYLGVAAGFLLIIIGAVLAFRQTLTVYHVILFMLGAVLTGISSIHFTGGGNSLDINKFAQANGLQADALVSVRNDLKSLSDTNSAALLALNKRIDTLSSATQKVGSADTATATPLPELAADGARADRIENLVTAGNMRLNGSITRFDGLVRQSRKLSNEAAAR